MPAVLLRTSLLAAGMAAIEIGIGPALAQGSLASWLLVVLVGVPLIVAGSAGFMGPLLGGPSSKGSADA